MVTDLVYHESFVKHEMSIGHPESPDRLRSAMRYINDRGLFEGSGLTLLNPTPVKLEEVYQIHGERYLQSIKERSERGGGFYTLDTEVNAHTYNAAILAAGGGINAVDRIMMGISDNAFVLCRPPGHHAEYERAFGFCFINNIAVAASHLIQQHGLNRIMIVDYDAHHGNGTQNTFYSSPQVLYVGLHQDGRSLFPGSGFPDEMGEGKGFGYTVNLAMYPGAGDVSYNLAFTDVIEPVASAFKPEFILVSVGFDSHYNDPLTSLGLTSSGFRMINSKLSEIASAYTSGKIAYFLEGGYNIETMGMGALNLVEELLGISTTAFDDSYSESNTCTEYTKALIDRIRSTAPLLL
ncbi:MAG: histone deacetylase [Candidatus Thorarchaeota archaeon]|nr:histone deacetylase [Candidatus Thorarchaeota archaeon]